MSTPLDVAAIRARPEAATPGPWHVTLGEDGHPTTVRHCERGQRFSIAEIRSWDRDGENGKFIAHARADVPTLCDALEHERRVSSAWKALALAGRYTDPAGVLQAEAELRELGEDPEAP